MMPRQYPENNLLPKRIPWHNSLFFRVIVLCAVLLLCLFGSVIVITHHFFQQAAQQMESQAADIAHNLEIRFDEGFGNDYGELETEFMDLYEGVDIKLDEQEAADQDASFTIERLKDGGFARVARVPLMNADKQVMMTVSMTVFPQTEILRAFRNRYMMALMGVFVVALGLMVYFIGKALRPLMRLSESCAAIVDGKLTMVNTEGISGEILALEQTFNDMVASLREKEMMEGKLRQAQRLSALGNLAAGIAHDVRNPLNAIKLLSSHALSMLETEEHPATKPMRTIRTEVDRLEEIVSSFLSLARETELCREPTELEPLLQECVRLFQKDAEARAVRLVADLRTPGLVLALDPKQWTRAVLNVLLNALEACPEGGRVRLFSRLTENACEIEIRDDGPGLPKEVAERVFDPYYTTKPGGTGLGLSITRGIVEEHGGTIELSSSPGFGCQVLIKIPLGKSQT
jgi:signal transduction histidine kinase